MNSPAFRVRSYQSQDEVELIRLWQQCHLIRPWNDPVRDIRRKLEGQPDWLLVGHLGDQLVASVMVGYEGHRGWLNYLAVAPDHRQEGIGRHMAEAAEARLRQLGCAKINLQIRQDNTEAIAFYESIGFSEDKVISMGKRLVED